MRESMHAETTNFAAVREDTPLGPPTRPQRRDLLRSLLLGRSLERVLSGLAPTHVTDRATDAVLTAIAAASALEAGDRLILPHCLLTARFATGAGAAAIAAARLGERDPAAAEIRPGVGPQSAAGLAAGIALALRRHRSPAAAVAIVERRWAEVDECRGALTLARDERLPLVVVAIETVDEFPHEPIAVDWRDFDAVRSAVRGAIADAHADRGPALVFCAPVPHDEAPRGLFGTLPVDPLAAYERRLMINGFTRADLDGIHREVAGDLDDALSGRVRIGGPAG
jgi:hypothetical protein